MSKHTTDMIKLGIFVILGFSLFIFGVYSIGSKKNMFGSNITVYADFKNVSGLQAGNNVRFMGINVGSVKQIDILNDTILRVKMHISSSVQKNMKKDALASIGTNGLVGASLINIVPGKNLATTIQDGDLLPTKMAAPMGEMLETLDDTNENIATLSSNLIEITEKINDGEGLISRLLNDASFSNKVNSSLNNVQNTSDTLLAISSEMNQIIHDLKNGKGLLGYMLTDSSLSTEIESIVFGVDSLLDHQIEPTFSDLAESIDGIKEIIDDFKVLSADLSEGKGALGVLLKDENAESQMKEIIENIDSSSAKLDENLLALRKNWFFRKYFKEKEKNK